MKHFTKIMSAAVLTAATLSFPGCQDYDAGFDAAEIKYKTEFSKIFGKIDPNQDWNLATRAAVTVSTNTSSNVKVYALTDGKYRLVADYSEVSGTKTLGFDVREDVTDLMVTDGCTAVKAKVGESVSFGGTRAGHYGTTGDVTVTKITDPAQWFVFDQAEAARYSETLPEKENNMGKVTQNFTFISNGEFTVYPIYWQTADTDEIGIYYTDASGYHEVPIYTIKSGDEMQYEYYNGGHNYNGSTAGLTIGSECPMHSGCKIGHMTNVLDDFAYIFCQSNEACGYEWKDVPADEKSTTQFSAQSTIEDAGYWGGSGLIKNYRSKGIKVNIPTGTLFGMYITAPSFYQQFSQQEKNKSTYNAPNKDVVAATFTLPNSKNSAEEDMYLCFEDWYASDGDADLNDVVFRFYGSTPTVVDNDPDVWIICAEDLGNTFDIDYNDVVVEAKHISGKTEATISPVAAGGTLASYIYFGSDCLGEVHELLGQPNGISGQYTPINVSGSVNTSIIKDITISVSEDWSLASSTVGDVNFSGDAGMGGFSVRVVPAGTQASQSEAVSGQKIQNSIDAGNDNVPYVFCVPRNYTRTENNTTIDAWFRWSNEMKSLYPLAGYGSGTYSTSGHAFAEWVADKNNAKDWYQYPSDLDNTTGIYYVMSMVDNDPPHVDPENNPVTPPVGPTSTPLTLDLTAQTTINWGESHYYKISGSDASYFVEGAVIEFVHGSEAYSDVCLSGTTTTWAQVGKSDGNYSNGKITLTADQASTIVTNEGFYAIVWYGDLNSVKITKP